MSIDASRLSVVAVLCSAGLALAADGASAAPGSSRPSGSAVERALPVRAASERFLIADLSAASSAAWLVDADQAGGDGAGFTVFSRVIVETDDAGALGRAVARAVAAGGVARGSSVRASGVRGFSFVEASSVGEAIALAESLRGDGRFGSVELDIERPRVLRGVLPNDSLFPSQWHLRNTQVTIADINAEGAWGLGFTGEGVIVGVTEGGFQASHPDIAANFRADASQGSGNGSHATSVAGVIAAVADNSIGVSGMAYRAGVSNQLIGSASQNAAAFTFRNDLNDIKNDSWGPADNGTFWDQAASSIELAALQDAALLGRGGLGTMTCWAAGNGGSQDRVDYDPYTSSRYTFAIGAIGDQDRESSFNEFGSSMLVVAHTSGNSRGVTTTTSGSGYTSNFGGTSSASPLAAGALAVALEANPLLSWRDMQALLAETARTNDPTDSFWTTNAAGYEISERFGFGAIDVAALVEAALTWQNLAEEVSATSGQVSVGLSIPDNSTAGITQTFEITEDLIVEQVVLNLNVTTPFVGDLRVTMTSPSGTESVFMTPRTFDGSDNITNHNFLSMRCFGEESAGTWSIKIADERVGNAAVWTNYTLTVYGTAASAGCNAADIVKPFGVLDLSDLQAFVAAFGAAEPEADIVAPFGVWDLADVQAYAATFIDGCP